MEKGFADIQSYTAAMAEEVVMLDKMFFLQELPEDETITTVVDFGCADGSLIYSLLGIWPKVRFIGYDKSEEMIRFAKSKAQSLLKESQVLFTTDWDKAIRAVPKEGKSLLILSSVIHEVYSYARNPEEIDTFWQRVFQSKFDYIAIRDMMISQNALKLKPSTQAIEQAWALQPRLVESFNQHQTPIGTSVKDLIHFLIKSKWTINWDREVHENYFPITVEEFIESVNRSGMYHIDYLKRFCPLKQDVRYRFNIEIQENTHIKLILSRKSQ